MKRTDGTRAEEARQRMIARQLQPFNFEQGERKLTGTNFNAEETIAQKLEKAAASSKSVRRQLNAFMATRKSGAEQARQRMIERQTKKK